MHYFMWIAQAIGFGYIGLALVAPAPPSVVMGVARDMWPTISTQQAEYSVVRYPYASNVNTFNKARMLELVNGLRMTHGLGTLEYHDVLLKVAQGHAEFQAAFRVVTHADTGGLLTDRLAALGGSWHGNSVIAENVGAGAVGEKEIIDAWTASPGHLANILHPEIQYMGVGVSDGYWVQDLAHFGA
ncbi:hypothetical protein IW140_002274 [Coemansia sp. RSA 1813]|nr:hypothetical protein EV178_001784 [Coemansia sp. RSA 1646]KAJ1770902.1 hypothetical protein LPJ74_002798 [Coemansia sp. RSA 1843]KAJ2092903.1 hypothetical protein IW138_000616 [Coemansia sp. RSA 986]KAJ2216224.1 hypothetical protein EV179_001462 [Coemansia sp. RSA 487]KAJ2570602.1 hypothetical protein IW140_002274 [Coemansia sp. RSA 1813]